MPKILHLYGQAAEHDTVYIGGNAAGLSALRDAIDNALMNPEPGGAEVFVNDGEGYTVRVAKMGDEEADKMAVPYTAEYSADPRPWSEAFGPWTKCQVKE